MIVKQKTRLEAAGEEMEGSRARLEAEKYSRRSGETQADEMLAWLVRFENAGCKVHVGCPDDCPD